MDNLDNQAPAQPTENGLQAQLDALRHLVVSLLILMVVISGTINLYLLRQYRSITREFTDLQQQAAPMMVEHQKGAPVMNDFIKKITDYGRTHADFAPILAKYGIKPTATGAPPAGITSPLPATAPKK